MIKNDNAGFVDTLLNAQKQTVDTMVENTRKYTNGNAMVNDTIEKGSEWYKNWLDNQKSFLGKTTAKASETTENAKEGASKMNDFYQNWLTTQMNWAKQMWEMNSNAVKDATSKATNFAGNNATSNPLNSMSNWMNNMQSWMAGMNNQANMANQMQQWQNQWNNMFHADSWKKASADGTDMFNQFYKTLNSTYTDWQKNFQSGTVQDAYRNMVNVTDGFSRFSEMWAPIWKSVQDKTFNMEMYKQMINPAMYKDLMDKYFGFMPEDARHYMQQYAEMMSGGLKEMNAQATGGYQQMRETMAGMMPGRAEMFGGVLGNYQSLHSMFNHAFGPIARMITPNQHTKAIAEWSDIANRTMVYNIKNAELQYMIYTQGTKVMDKLAEDVASKIQANREPKSLMALYQEWLNISDNTYVALFETEDYSKLMAEVSAMQLTLRKDVEGQLEKMMTGIPVATRSEMDEVYKTIYDLKKQVRELEKSQEAIKVAAATATATAHTAATAAHAATHAAEVAAAAVSQDKHAHVEPVHHATATVHHDDTSAKKTTKKA